MGTLASSLRLGMRSLLRAPGHTAALLLTLSLALGVNIFLFSLVQGVLLSPLPYREPGRLVTLWSDDGAQVFEVSVPNFLDLQAQSRSFAGLAAFYPFYAGNLTGQGRPERLDGALVTSSLLPLLGRGPAIGRGFGAADERPGAAPVALLSDRLWRRRFGGDRTIVGRAITLDGSPVTVAGVMPPGFGFPDPETEIWLPLTFTAEQMERRATQVLHVLGRLRPGAAPAPAQAELRVIARRLRERYPATNARIDFKLVPLLEQEVAGVRPTLLVLECAVAFLWLLACANTGNLTLTRMLHRRLELTLRLALGAGPRQLLAAALNESLLAVVISGGLGLLLAAALLTLLRAANLPHLPRLAEIRLGSGPVALFTVTLSGLTLLLSGLIPVLQGGPSRHPAQVLKEGGRGMAAGTGRRLRGALVVLQMSSALILLIGAGLMIRSFLNLGRVDPGFDPAGLLAFKVSLPESRYQSGAKREAFFAEALRRIRQLRGVQDAGTVDLLPLSGGSTASLAIEGRPALPGQLPEVQWRVAGSDYFRTMRIPLVRGRLFNAADTPRSPMAGLVSAAAARRFWPGENPIGKRVKAGESPREPWITIVGVVGDVRDLGLESPYAPTLYQSLAQRGDAERTLVVRFAGREVPGVGAVSRQIWSLDPDLAVYDVQAADDLLRGSIARQRLGMLLMALLGGVALVVAVAGAYGVLSYLVGQRGGEIGIRMALGAGRPQILGMVLREGLRLVAVAALVGLGCSLALARLLSGLLFGVSAFDPWTFSGITLVLVAAGLVACLLPARRATAVEPAAALRAG